MWNKPILLFALLLTMSIASYYGIRWIRVLTASEYDKMLAALYSQTVPLLKIKDIQNIADYTILDTRNIEEYKVSAIEGAQWLGYPNPNLQVLSQLPKDKPVLVYCSVGYRSERIGEQLIGMGFAEVYNLYGGIFAWANEHRFLVDSAQQKTNKVHGYSKSWGKWLNKDIEVVYN